MAKKLLALLLAMCMLFSVCSVSVFAEETTGENTQEETTENTQEEDTTAPEEEDTTVPEEDDTVAPEDDEDEVKKSVSLELENAYLPNATIVIKGEVTGDVSGVIVRVYCEDDDFEFEKTANVANFEDGKIKVELENATVGAEYFVEVYDFDDEDVLLGEGDFLIRKGTYTTDDDGSNAVTIWIEGSTGRYIDKTVVNLDWVKKPNVLEVAKYVLDEADRNYKSTREKITAIAASATGTTYTFKDNNSVAKYEDCEWAYILNGEQADYDGDWTDIELKGGNEIVLFYGVPGEVGYPVIEVPKSIGIKDEVVIKVYNKIFDENGDPQELVPAEGAKVGLVKRGTEKPASTKLVNDDGEYIIKSTSVTANWITSYQGGKVMATGYSNTTKQPTLIMVSATTDLNTDREGTVQAWVRIEGAHKTLLERTKSAKIDEINLYDFMVEVLEDEDIDYESDDDETYFTYFESKTTSGYANENGDITRDSGWYVVVNDEIIEPETDLTEVEVFSNDEILFYFGDKDTVPVVYYKVDGELETDKKVYVYFYSDADMTRPIEDLEVTFEGDDIDKDMETDDEGKIKLPTVEYKGTYTLSWGEQVGVRDEECPKAVMGEAELKFTGTAKPTTKPTTGTDKDTTKVEIEYVCDNCGDVVSKIYEIEYDGDELDVCKACKNELEEEEEWDEPTQSKDDPWEKGDYTEVPDNKDDFVPGPSKYYPDQNIDAWAVANVNKAHEYGLMSGTTYGYFEPQREITRAEFTAIVCRILGLDHEKDFDEKFGDVTEKDWHFGYVMAAYEAGYVNGMSEISFAPNNYITREEIAVMVSRILNVTGNADDVNLFADGYNVSKWAQIYVAAVNKTGIMTGDQFGQFLPKNKVNRQTVATIAVRVYEYLGNN